MALDIDWKNPRRFPRKQRPVRDVYALSRLKAKRVKRKGGKAHATAKDIALAAKRKAAEARKTVVSRNDRFRRYKDAVRAFWNGETDEHPNRA